MALPARRLTELNTCRGPTRSSSSTGGTAMTVIFRLEEKRRKLGLFESGAMLLFNMQPARSFSKAQRARWRIPLHLCRNSRLFPGYDCLYGCHRRRVVKLRCIGIVFAVFVISRTTQTAQTVQPAGPYARIAIM